MTQDLTVGKPLLRVWQFAVPVLFGLLLQQVYSLVDTAIVGHALGVMALGGVGATGSVNFLVLGFCGGLCTGMAIPLAQSFGAGEYHQLRRYVAGCVWLGLIMSALLLAVTLPATRGLLRLMGTPAEQMDYAFDYIFIIFVGIPTTILYNMGACVLRALGDSKSALYFLMISAVLNIGGDLFFVEALGWGSEGCALSTVLSEALCCVFCLIYIRWKVPVLQLGRRWFIFDSSLLKKTISYGWTSAMQQATVQLGKIAIQAIVNTMGVSAMAAFTAASRIDDFAYTPQQNIGHATTTLMAQNRGAGKKDRVRASFFCGLKLEFLYAIFITAVCFFFAEPIIRLFVTDAAVVHLGVRFLKLVSLFYLMPSLTNGIQGGFRGLGDLKITLNSSTLNMAGRVAAAAVFVLLMKMDIEALPYSYVVGWILMLVYEAPMMVKYLRKGEL